MIVDSLGGIGIFPESNFSANLLLRLNNSFRPLMSELLAVASCYLADATAISLGDRFSLKNVMPRLGLSVNGDTGSVDDSRFR